MLSLFDRMRQKRLLRQYLLFLGAVVFFHSVVYYPVYLLLASDVIWKSSIVFFLWTEIAEPLSVYLFFWGSFAYAIYVGVRYSVRAVTPYLVVYAVGSVLRYALQNVCYIFIMGLATWQHTFAPLEILWNILLDLAVMGIAYALLLLFSREMRRDGKEPCEKYLPMNGFFDLKNLLSRLSLCVAGLPSLARLITRAYYDIRLIVFQGYAPSGGAELFLMVTYYLTDILTAILGYLMIVMMLSGFFLSDARARMRFEDGEKK